MVKSKLKKKTLKNNSKKVKVEKVKKKISKKEVVIAIGMILLPLVVGGISSLLTGDAMSSFGNLNQPPVAPPAWLFPVAWTILYLLMGIASLLIYKTKTKTKKEEQLKRTEICLYLIQLFFNFMWTLLFFKLELRFFAFGWLIAMWLMILALIIMVFRNCKAAAWCLLPYILWCSFAAYLNIMIAVLN